MQSEYPAVLLPQNKLARRDKFVFPGNLTGRFLLLSLTFHIILLAILASFNHCQFPEKKQELFNINYHGQSLWYPHAPPSARLPRFAGNAPSPHPSHQSGEGGGFNFSPRRGEEKPDIPSHRMIEGDKLQQRKSASSKLLSLQEGNDPAVLPAADAKKKGSVGRPEGEKAGKKGSEGTEKTSTNNSDTFGISESTLQAPVKLSCPEPPYPESAFDEEREGIVRLKAFVQESGKVKEVTLLISSGYSDLDRTAMEAVKNWLFAPAKKNGQEISAWVNLTVSFRIKH